MIHAYNEEYLPIIQEKLGTIFELAIIYKKINIDEFSNIFAKSKIAKAFERNDMVYTLGMSANELLAIILNEDPYKVEITSLATPEYWVGYVLAYVEWYYNISFMDIINAYPCSLLIKDYFPYHEMDIMKIIELYDKKLNIISKLKLMREKSGYSQNELATLSNVPLRTIRSYEQNSVDISKAQVETLYKIAKVLNCKIEDLI